jgi:hypothetical protein
MSSKRQIRRLTRHPIALPLRTVDAAALSAVRGGDDTLIVPYDLKTMKK